jgi:hypothetical protein
MEIIMATRKLKPQPETIPVTRYDECPFGLHGMIETDQGDYIKTEDVYRILDMLYRQYTDGNEAKVLTILDTNIRATEEH